MRKPKPTGRVECRCYHRCDAIATPSLPTYREAKSTWKAEGTVVEKNKILRPLSFCTKMATTTCKMTAPPRRPDNTTPPHTTTTSTPERSQTPHRNPPPSLHSRSRTGPKTTRDGETVRERDKQARGSGIVRKGRIVKSVPFSNDHEGRVPCSHTSEWRAREAPTEMGSVGVMPTEAAEEPIPPKSRQR